jgi:hypothetical protein
MRHGMGAYLKKSYNTYNWMKCWFTAQR